MTNPIYASKKVLPYVYMGVHKTTGQFYFGSRYGAKSYMAKGHPSSQDLGTYYFTSSKRVKELGFDNFTWVVLAEFFSVQDAIEFEDLLIREHWRASGSLNESRTGSEFHNSGKNPFANKTPEEMLIIRSKSRRTGKNHHMYGKSLPESQKQKLRKPKTEAHKAALRASRRDTHGANNPFYGKRHSESSLTKMRKPKKSSENMGIYIRDEMICPFCSTTVKGLANFQRYHGDNCKHNPRNEKESQTETCEHCGFVGETRTGNMKRYHGDNCKHNPQFVKPQHYKTVRKSRDTATCPHCGKDGDLGNLKRYHFDKCKLSQV